MTDTAVEVDCLGTVDQERVVTKIENEQKTFDTIDIDAGNRTQDRIDPRLEKSAEKHEIENVTKETNGVDKNNPSSQIETVVTSQMEEDSVSTPSATQHPAPTSSADSAVTAKKEADSDEKADLVTITILEKTKKEDGEEEEEEEREEEVRDGDEHIALVSPKAVVQQSAQNEVPSDNKVESSIKNREVDIGAKETSHDRDVSSPEVDSSTDNKGVNAAEAGVLGTCNNGTTAEQVPAATDNSSTSSNNGVDTSPNNETSERFLIIENNSSPEGTSPIDESVPMENSTDLHQNPTKTETVEDEGGIDANNLNEDRFKEIEILVAAFDGSEENSSNQSVREPAESSAESGQANLSQEAEVSPAATERKSRNLLEPKTEKRVPKAKRCAGPPTRRESNVSSEKSEIPNVVGNGKLRVHGYEKLNEQTGLPELVLVNREILELIISDQEKTIVQTKSKLKEMCKICDDLRKVVLAKGLNTVLSPEEANLPVDVVIKMQKLPPHVPTFQTVKVARTANGNYDLHAEGRFYNRVLPVKKWLGVAHAPKPATPLALGANRKITSDSKCKVEFNIKVLPKDIVRALTNGDVLTHQQRQRFIDKIAFDIIKAKGVPQPQQIQEIALQVANMYPRSLVILPEGKRRSILRKRGRADEDDQDDADPVKSGNTPKRVKKNSIATVSSGSTAGTSQSSKVSTPETGATPIVKRGRGRPPKNRNPGVTVDTKSPTKTTPTAVDSSALQIQGSHTSPTTAVTNGTTTPVKRKPNRARKTAQAETSPRPVEEEQALSLDDQKKWLQEDVKKPLEQQDLAKQLRLLHNCYDKLYEEMAANNYDCAATIEQWPVLRKPEHVLSVFKRLKRVHGRFQETMRKDAPKLVTFLHERVNTDEGAEWSLQISQAKLSERYQLPEEVGVMPLLALNFEEDFSLLFKLVPDKGAFREAVKHVEPVPIIFGVGESIFNCEYHVVVERQLLYSPKTYLDALELVYAAYFVFNLAYPKELLNTFEYVQRYYVGYNPPIKMVTLSHTKPKIVLFLKKLKDFERLDWNSNIRVNSPGVPSEFERESDPEGDDADETSEVFTGKSQAKEANPVGENKGDSLNNIKVEIAESRPMETDDNVLENETVVNATDEAVLVKSERMPAKESQVSNVLAP